MKIFKWFFDTVQWVKDQVEWFKSFFGEIDSIDNQKKPSIKKAGTAIIFVVFAKTYFSIAVKDNKMPDIPDAWLFLLLGVLGIGTLNNYFGGKNKGGPDVPKS